MLVKIGSNSYRMLNGYSIKKSSRNVTFSNIVIDFTGYSLKDIPLKYQEVEIVNNEDVTIFFGYVDACTPSSMKKSNLNEFRELELTLLSPDQLATRRTVTVNGNFDLKTVIQKVFSILELDNFTIKTINILNKNVTVSYIFKTIEECMNDISSRYNIWWYVDENKNIYVYSLELLYNQESKLIVNHNNLKEKIKGLLDIVPTVESVDYANVINAKNIRMFEEANNEQNQIFEVNKNVKNGDTIEFNYGIDISRDTGKRIISDSGYFNSIVYLFVLETTRGDFNIYFDNLSNYYINENISFDGDATEKTVVLTRDSFFKNLVTGLKWNGEDATITSIRSQSALVYSTAKFINSKEIERNKGIISASGIVEKTIDLNEAWFTETELMDYIRNLLVYNENKVTNVKLKYDTENGIGIGDKLELDLPYFYTQDVYICTDITVQYANNITTYEVELRSANLLSNYVDVFRDSNKIENDEQINKEYLAEYTDVDKILEIHEIGGDVNGDN